MDQIAWLKKMTGESDEELLSLLLTDAEETVLAYTGRSSMIAGLQKPARDLALIAYNRMGTEGESGRSGGGESYSFNDAPKQIYDVLDRYRLARIGGRRYEAETQQSEAVLPSSGDTSEG